MEDVLKKVVTSNGFKALGSRPLGVKLAPYFDFPHFERAAAIINSHKEIRFVVTCNTIGNALAVDGENECALIAPKAGFGGLGGGYVKLTAQVRAVGYRTAGELDRGGAAFAVRDHPCCVRNLVNHKVPLVIKRCQTAVPSSLGAKRGPL